MSKNKALRTCFPSRSVRRGSIEIDLQDYALRVQRVRYYLEPTQARLLAVIMENSRYGAKVNVNAASSSLGYNCPHNFKRAYQGTMARLSECEIANFGGVNSAFEEPTIYADSLFERENGTISFNAFLASVINSSNCVAESNLARMRWKVVHCLTRSESLRRREADRSTLFLSMS